MRPSTPLVPAPSQTKPLLVMRHESRLRDHMRQEFDRRPVDFMTPSARDARLLERPRRIEVSLLEHVRTWMAAAPHRKP